MDSSPTTKFLDVDLKITDTYYHPKEVLVKFQGRYNTEYDFDYHILQIEIQQVTKVKDSIGIGEFCLVEDPDRGEWYRGRVVQKKNHVYEVFLMDSGKTLAVCETCIASAIDELFQLPPKVVCGIFANILPVEEKWAPKALNYFSSLIGLQIKGHVQAILTHQTFLLDVPKIISDIVELKLGKLVDEDTFHLIVEMLTELPQESLCKQMPDLLQRKYTPDSLLGNARIQPDFQPILSILQPRLSAGGVEEVKISVAVSPSKFYCQLLRRQIELDKFITSMSSCYETVSKENVPSCDNLGVLCAARRKSGQWHRGIIQQLLSDNKVRIWFMDFGSYETVLSSCVQKLQPEFISVPRFSFPCALSCLSNQDEALRNNQLKQFKKILLRQSAVYVHIDLFSTNEHLYYVTLHKHESVMNNGCLSKGSDMVSKYCSPEVVPTNGDLSISGVSPVFAEHVHRDTLQATNPSDEKGTLSMNCVTIPLKRAEMKIDSVCVAFVEYVLNPSYFWVQTNDYLDEFEALMKKIADVYDASQTGGHILENPEPGQLCCARYNEDMHFYRAVVAEVVDNCVGVYFLDFGNTATVPLFDVKTLLPEFQKLPALAICCSLANAFPIEDMWTRKETDYFKKLVFGKPLTLHAIAKENDMYTVSVRCTNGSEEVDLTMFMVQDGYAEYWEVKQDPLLTTVRGSQVQQSKYQCKSIQGKLPMKTNTKEIPGSAKLRNTYPVTKHLGAPSPQWESTLSNKCGKASGKNDSLGPYKEYQFKPGTVVDVVCCHSSSPADFLCQMQTKLPELHNLMGKIQSHYNTQTCLYERGQLACVVKHSKDGKWYRASVLKHVSKIEVDVVLVDYGSHERVLLKDLQAILPEFLVLECQAFRCCLNSITESLVFDPYNWTTEACRDFACFISSSSELLTCTVSALILKDSSWLYNVVDLQTPFVSARQFLLERGHAQLHPFEFTRSLVSPFSLYSFCYSSFNVKIGNEEEVCITYIYDPTKFYCQLNRNADDIHKLPKKIAEISQTSCCPDQIKSCSLCLARYFGDGLFYRALASSAGSSDYLPVYFVDFGNKELVAKDELLPIPDHVSELLFTPMQAIKCYLSDLKDNDIPPEISTWFEENCLGKQLKAVIVSKESDGQLGVELYDGDLQINKKIKELLGHTQCAVEPKKAAQRCAEKSIGEKNTMHKVKLSAIKTELKREVVGWETEAENNVNSSYQSSDQVSAGDGNKIITHLQKQCSRSAMFQISSENTKLSQNVLQDQPHRSSQGELNTSSIYYPKVDWKEVPASNRTKLQIRESNPAGQEVGSTNRQKYTHLLQRSIRPNSKLLGYTSFVSSPSSFYVHLAEDESKIVQLAEELNGGTLVLEPETDVELGEGDIVLAEYEVDCCIYRAVVRGAASEKSYEVEFIDYGNMSTVNVSKIYRMEKVFLNVPRLSIHCCLKTTKPMSSDNIWNSDVTAYFTDKVSKQQITCEFLQLCGQQWEVNLFSHEISIINELMQRQVGSQNMPVLNLDHLAKPLPVIGTDTEGNDQSQKSESQHAYESSKPSLTCESLPKIAFQKIKPGQLEIAEIGHISRDGSFYVTLSKDAHTLSDLNEMAACEANKNSVLAVENIKEGLECLAKSKETLAWYRSEVTKKFVDEESVLVFFMDWGKYEIVNLHDIKMLSGKMRRIPRNAVLCKWIWTEKLSDLPPERLVEMLKYHEMEMLKHHETKILFLRHLECAFIWEVEMLVDGVLLLEHCNQVSCQWKLENYRLPESMSNVDKTMPKSSFRLNSIAWAPFQKDKYYPGFVTSVTDPSNFCIQLEDSFETLKALFKLLSDLPDNLPAMPQELIVPGVSSLIKTGPSEKWSRVEVSEVSDLLILTFVDDGISAPIPLSDIHKLKVIPEKLVGVPRLTYPCSLFAVSPTDEEQWSDKAKLKVQEFLGRQGLVFQFKHYHRGMKLEVDALWEQLSAADTLVSSGCAVYSKTALSSASVNCSKVHSLNSEILCDPSQIHNRKSSGARITLFLEKETPPQKSDLPFRHAHDRVPRWSSSKGIVCRKEGWQKTTLLHSNRSTNENLHKNEKSLLNQFRDRGQLEQTHTTGILSKTMHEMHCLQRMSTKAHEFSS